MNISISKSLHDYLQTIIIESLIFGSKSSQAGTNNSSDTDYLHIVKCHKALATCPVYAGHWLQYKETDESGNTIADHIYSTVPQFIHGIINAESMIPWEVLNGGLSNINGDFAHAEITRHNDNSIMSCGNGHIDIMDNFKSARGFLGLSRRDLKDASKLFNHDKKKCHKKINFSIKSMHYAMSIMFLYRDGIDTQLNHDYMQEVDVNDYGNFKKILDVMNYNIDKLRDILVDMHNTKEIPYTVNNDSMLYLHNKYLKNQILLEDNQFSDEMLQLYFKATTENEYK